MRSITTSSKSIGNTRRELSKVILTAARCWRATLDVPLKIKSSPRLPRIDFNDCSPRTRRNASATLDFPEPFGPTIAEIGDVNSRIARFANDLKPEISRDFRCMEAFISSLEFSASNIYRTGSRCLKNHGVVKVKNSDLIYGAGETEPDIATYAKLVARI